MSVSASNLLTYCDELLGSARFSDYCPNGLQVEGKPQIQRLATAVTANQKVIDEAVSWGADALLVHHGYFWRGEDQRVIGLKRRRLGALLAAEVNLLAYHLPLDAHPELGNNAQWAARLGVTEVEPLDPADPQAVGNLGRLDAPMSLGDLCDLIERTTQRSPLLVGDRHTPVQRLAWCTGAAQGYIDKAASRGAEVYISGEISEPTYHVAWESGIAYIAAGHHATERYGVQALGQALAAKFELDYCFIDSDNPV